jgi:hypothetical protein
MQRTIWPDTVIVLPLMSRVRWRGSQWWDRREMFRVLDHEAAAGLCQRHDVVPFTDERHRLGDRVQHLGIRGEVVGIAERFAGNRNELGVEFPLPDPVGAAVALIAVVGRQRTFEDGLQPILPARMRRLLGTHRSLMRHAESDAASLWLRMQSSGRAIPWLFSRVAHLRGAEFLNRYGGQPSHGS